MGALARAAVAAVQRADTPFACRFRLSRLSRKIDVPSDDTHSISL
jgi:hypothetical protein